MNQNQIKIEEDKDLADAISKNLIMNLSPNIERIDENKLIDLYSSVEFGHFRKIIQQYIKEADEKEIDLHMRELEEHFRNLISEMKAEKKRTKLTSNIGLAAIGVAATIGLIAPMGAVVGLSVLGAASSLGGFISKLFMDRKIKEDASDITKEIISKSLETRALSTNK